MFGVGGRGRGLMGGLYDHSFAGGTNRTILYLFADSDLALPLSTFSFC